MITAHNQAGTIGRAIESALTQDYPNLEIVVSDDCSKDGFLRAIKKYSSSGKVRCFTSGKRLGRVGNHRKLLYDCASGDWAVALDGDDYFIDPSFVRKAMTFVVKDTEIVMVGAGTKVLFPDGTHWDWIATDKPEVLDGFSLFLDWYKGGLGHGAVIYDRRLACETEFYRYDIISDDWGSFLRLLLYGKVVLLDGTVYAWSKHYHNATNTVNLQDFIDNYRFINEPYEHALKLGHPKDLLDEWKKKLEVKLWLGYINTNKYLRRFGLISSRKMRTNMEKMTEFLYMNRKEIVFDPLLTESILSATLLWRENGSRYIDIMEPIG